MAARPPRSPLGPVIAILAYFAAVHVAATQELPQADVEFVKNEAGVEGLRATFEVAAPRDGIWKILTDYEHFNETFRDVERVKVLEEDPDGALVEFTIRAAVLRFSYTLRRDYVRPGQLLTWHRTAGAFKYISGEWEILGGPNDCIHQVVYESFVKVGFLIPTKTVRRRAAKELNETVARMRSRLASAARPRSTCRSP